MKKTISLEKRRQVLKKGASLFGVPFSISVLSSFMNGCEKDTLKTSENTVTIDISTIPELSITDGSIKKTFGENNSGRPVVIIRHGETDFTVFTSVCTHLGCEINLPSEPGKNLECPCHKTLFSSTSGEVINGPANAPLQVFNNSFNGKILRITF